MIYCPSLYPILTALIGPENGIPALRIASDDQMILSTHRSCCRSSASGVIVTTTSLIIPFGNIGLSARSVNLELRIAESEGLHSLFLNDPPPIFQAAE